MAITNGYATLSEFKLYADITTTNANDDTAIEDIIEGASREIDGHCGRVFYQSSATRYYNSFDGETLYTDEIYTSSGLTVSIDQDGDGTYEITLAAEDYNLLPYNPTPFPHYGMEATFKNGYSFSKLKKGNKVVGSFGWSTIPDDVRQACLIIAQAEYKRRFGENMESVARVTDAGVVLTPQGIPVNAAQKLRAYRSLL